MLIDTAITSTRSGRNADDLALYPSKVRTIVERGLLVILFTVLVALATFANRDALNQDAVSYLGLARHYVDGHFMVAVSGTWSPLFIWLLAALLSFGGDPVLIGRLAMAISAIVFVGGAASVFGRIENRSVKLAAMVASVLLAAEAAGEAITPDLLSAGLYCYACTAMVASWRRDSVWPPFAAGCLFGISYLAKAVFFPVSILVVTLSFAAAAYTRTMSGKTAATQCAICLSALLVVSAPWVMVLSSKYGGFTFTTISRVNSAVIAPPSVRQDYPTFSSFFVPEQGRRSQWEDESVVPSLRPWSPFGSPRSFIYSLETTLQNIPNVLADVRAYDWTGLSLIGLALFLGRSVLHRRSMLTSSLASFAIPTFCLLLPYLPFMTPFPLDERRYFYCILPFVFASSLEAARIIGTGLCGRKGARATLALMLMLLVIAMASLLPKQAFRSPVTAEAGELQLGRALAPSLEHLKLIGPIAAAGHYAREKARYLAFALDAPYNGSEDAATVKRLLQSCANLILAETDSAPDRMMASRHDIFSDVSQATPEVEALTRHAYIRIYWTTRRNEARCSPPPLHWAWHLWQRRTGEFSAR